MSATQQDVQVERVHVRIDPSVCGGRACIAGTRIRVQDIYVLHERQGMSPDEIITRFPQLTLADVYAALSWFWDHREAVLSELATGDARVAAARISNPSKMPAPEPKGDGDAVSS